MVLKLKVTCQFEPSFPKENNVLYITRCAFANTPKYQQVKGKGRIVTKKWIIDCSKQKKLLPWRKYVHCFLFFPFCMFKCVYDKRIIAPFILALTGVWLYWSLHCICWIYLCTALFPLRGIMFIILCIFPVLCLAHPHLELGRGLLVNFGPWLGYWGKPPLSILVSGKQLGVLGKPSA